MSITLAFVFVTVLNASFFVWQCRERRKGKRKPQESVSSFPELALLKAALLVEKAERHRVANTLHNKSSSTIAAVKMYLNAVHPNHSETDLNANFDKVHSLLHGAYIEINKSLYSLMPEMAMENGVEEAVRRYCSHLNTQELLKVEYDSWGDSRRYHDAFELAVFRVVQMIVNYILQKGTASSAMVQIGIRSNSLSIAVEDNGVGYKPLAELIEEPTFVRLENITRATSGQVEFGVDNGLSVFVQLDTAAFSAY